MKFCNFMIDATPAVPTQTFFLAANQSLRFWMEKSFCFSTKKLRFATCRFSFTLRWNNRVLVKLRSDAFPQFLFKIRLKWETTLMKGMLSQSGSRNYSFFITKSVLKTWMSQSAKHDEYSSFSKRESPISLYIYIPCPKAGECKSVIRSKNVNAPKHKTQRIFFVLKAWLFGVLSPKVLIRIYNRGSKIVNASKRKTQWIYIRRSHSVGTQVRVFAPWPFRPQQNWVSSLHYRSYFAPYRIYFAPWYN